MTYSSDSDRGSDSGVLGLTTMILYHKSHVALSRADSDSGARAILRVSLGTGSLCDLRIAVNFHGQACLYDVGTGVRGVRDEV